MSSTGVVDRDPSGSQLRAALLTSMPATPQVELPDVPLVSPLAGAVAMSGGVTLLIGLLRIATA